MAETDCLVHRYSFDGSGATVLDSMGGPSGTVVRGTLSGGSVTLPGGAASSMAPYVDLADRILSELTDVTLEVWVTWAGGAAWQRILDFGDGVLVGMDITGRTYLFVTPQNASTNKLRATFTLNGSESSVYVDAVAALPQNEMSQIALVFENATFTLTLYVNGAQQGAKLLPGSLSDINDVNNWLGRSQYNDDPYFAGTIHELRIFRVARTAEQIDESYQVGPDDLPGR
jgi:hypothetical protein